MCSKKQEDICGFGVPALNRVGVAWVNCFATFCGRCQRPFQVITVNADGDAHPHVGGRSMILSSSLAR